MMVIRPLHWQGQTRTMQLRTHVESCAREWLRQWAADPARTEMNVLTVSLDGPLGGVENRAWFVCEVAGGTAYVRGVANLHERLACRLSGITSGDSGKLAEGVGRRALTDLVRGIVQIAGDGKLSAYSPTAEVEEGLRSRFGVLGIVLTIDDVRIELYLDSVLCDKLAPRPVAANDELTPRLEAVMLEQVTLNAVLELGHTPLEETVTLKVGDVIRTNAPLSSSIRVGVDSGPSAFTGVLVVDGEGRALRCIENFLGKGVKR